VAVGFHRTRKTHKLNFEAGERNKSWAAPASDQMGQRVSKTGLLGGRAARFIGKNPLAAGFVKRVALQRQALIIG